MLMVCRRRGCEKARTFRGASGLGCHGKYIRPVTDEPVSPDPGRLQRGSYLVNQVLSCGACHTARENGHILTEPERTDAFLGGGNVYVDKALGTLWIPNITPDRDRHRGLEGRRDPARPARRRRQGRPLPAADDALPTPTAVSAQCDYVEAQSILSNDFKE